MSFIQLFTPSKGYLPHYSYIFRNMYPLGTYMNNVDGSRLVNMLHLEIKKGKDAMKTPIFQKYTRGTAVCMKRIIMATKVCCQLTSNGTYLSGIWFSVVIMSEEAMAQGVGFCRPVNTSHNSFCLSTL